MTNSADLCMSAAKLLPFDPDWARLHELCDRMSETKVPTAEELAAAYLEMVKG